MSNVETLINQTAESILYKIKSGYSETLSKYNIFKLNSPNYEFNDILIREMRVEFSPLEGGKSFVSCRAQGECEVTIDSSFPERKWDHLSMSLIDVIISQAGKALQKTCSDINGIALLRCSSKITRQANLRGISFDFISKVSVKHNLLWSDATFDFFVDGVKFCSSKALSIGVHRDYASNAQGKAI